MISVRALLLGERLDTRGLEGIAPLATAPVAVSMPGGGVAVIFRYGVTVLFGATQEEANTFVGSVAPFVTEPLSPPEGEEAQLVIQADADQPIDAAGNIVLRDGHETCNWWRMYWRKALCSRITNRIATTFDRIEPLAATLREGQDRARSRGYCIKLATCWRCSTRWSGASKRRRSPNWCGNTELEQLCASCGRIRTRDRDRALGQARRHLAQ
jgi:hypothetical protein